jgi:hypothetical protein
MNNDFLKRIILERDYKISLLRENLESGHLIDEEVLYRYFGHFDVVNIPATSTIEEKLKSLTQSFFVLEKSITFVDGIIAALSCGSTNRHLLSSYHSKKINETSVRDRIIMSGQNEILESYGFQLI